MGHSSPPPCPSVTLLSNPLAGKPRDSTQLIQANIKYDQLKIDLERLDLSFKAHNWGEAEDHVVSLGMESRLSWKNQHAAISKDIIEIRGLAGIHDLTDLQDQIKGTESEITALSIRMSVTIFEIEAADTKQGHQRPSQLGQPQHLPQVRSLYCPRRPGTHGHSPCPST
jgi:hypothetical protein